MSVRYVGLFSDPSGYGAAARSHLLALAGAGTSVTARSVAFGSTGPVDVRVDRRQYPDVARFVGRRLGYDAVLVHVPPDRFDGLCEAGKRHVGIAAWETELLPPEMREQVATMDEIWVPSTFCAAAFGRATTGRVVVVPHPVTPIAPGPARFPGVPDDVFVFAAIFEWSRRKNGPGLVRAFVDAFRGRRDVGLLLKIGLRHGGVRREVLGTLERLTRGAGAPPIWAVLDDDLSTAVVDQIYRRANAFVSLHRAEGFGLCMAEAMAAGVPVIATGWSGNLDFMDASTAFLVSCRLGLVGPGDPVFGAGARWAEPDHDDAVATLRRIAFDPGERERVAVAGRDRVLEQLAPSRVGALMRAALEDARPRERPAQPPRNAILEPPEVVASAWRQRYASEVREHIVHRNVARPALSLFVVSHRPGPYLLTGLQRAREQGVDHRRFELVLVDCGGVEPYRDEVRRLCDAELRLRPGVPLNVARNAAVAWARGNLVAFLDDDGEVTPKFVAVACDVLSRAGVAAVRGRIVPKDHPYFCTLANHYDEGPTLADSALETEGHMAIRRDVYLAVGGFPDEIYGGEGLYLAYRIRRSFPEMRVVYSPDLVMRHDYANGWAHFLRKTWRYARTSHEIDALDDDGGFARYLRERGARRRSPPARPLDVDERVARAFLNVAQRMIERAARSVPRGGAYG